MRITASQLRPGDLIRGIGLVVGTVDPIEGTDETEARIVGHVGRDGEIFPTQIDLPADHVVNVRRLFEVGDRVTVPVELTLRLGGTLIADDFGVSDEFLEAEVVVVDPVGRWVGVRRDEADPVTWVAFRAARHVLPAEATV